ncbi:MAG: hypothetical protein L3V56_06875 [Candidatus Magnetoovum sp. WYHC-5]|nr:hypothetical protein [Candidatus Magnetoovum sp. WYHC-5]
MLLGYSVLGGESVSDIVADFVQITVFKNIGSTIGGLSQTVAQCHSQHLDFVIHPIDYFLSDTRLHCWENNLEELRHMAHITGNGALIIHDETTPWGSRLERAFEKSYSDGISELAQICNISIENATHTPDILWFWQHFAHNITLDIGHLESAGIDSVNFIRNLDNDTIDKINYVHIHQNNGQHLHGVTDHWPLTKECRELQALKILVERKEDINIIVEIMEREEIADSMRIIKNFLK